MLDSKQVENKVISAIEQQQLLFIQDVCSEIGIARRSFYNHFPIDSEAYERIESALQKNKSNTKKTLRNVFRSTLASPAERMFLYKLLACEEEKMQLNPVQEIRALQPPKHEIILIEESK